MKLLALFAFALSAFAQTAVTTPVAVSSLPAYVVGAGPSWTRGGSSPYSFDTTVGVHLGQGQWYSWTDISTPVAPPVVGAPPVASSLTTGGAWVAVQSPTGSVSLIFIVQAGFSSLQASSTIAPAFSGSFGVSFKLGKTHAYLMPYVKISNATTANTNGSVLTGVLQPGFQVQYGFGGK
jgi:hypothetical protein